MAPPAGDQWRAVTRLRTGAPRRDVPERYGPWQNIYESFARWETAGPWAKLLELVQVHEDATGTAKRTVLG